jgi:hypothetical protein
MAKTIPLLDLMFFLSETKANPKHVAALILLEAPASAGKDFVAKLAATYRKAAPMQSLRFALQVARSLESQAL